MAGDPTPRQWLLRSVAFLGSLFILAAGAGFMFGDVGDSDALVRSVAREANSAFDANCSGGKSGRWRCWVSEPTGSGSARYRVHSGGDCWSARLVPGHSQTESPMPAHLAGCVAVRDRYPFVGTAFEAWEFL